MHVMSLYLFALYGLERTGTYVQGHFLQFYSLVSQSLQHPFGEMQSCSRSSYGTFDF